MKLKELVEVLPEKCEISIEIVEETYPCTVHTEDILTKFSRAADYQVKVIEPGIGMYANGDVPVLCVEVSNGKTENK